MERIFLRIVSVFLVTSLVFDPVSAAGFNQAPSSSIRAMKDSHNLFDQQTLQLRDISIRNSNTRTAFIEVFAAFIVTTTVLMSMRGHLALHRVRLWDLLPLVTAAVLGGSQGSWLDRVRVKFNQSLIERGGYETREKAAQVLISLGAWDNAWELKKTQIDLTDKDATTAQNARTLERLAQVSNEVFVKVAIDVMLKLSSQDARVLTLAESLVERRIVPFIPPSLPETINPDPSVVPPPADNQPGDTAGNDQPEDRLTNPTAAGVKGSVGRTYSMREQAREIFPELHSEIQRRVSDNLHFVRMAWPAAQAPMSLNETLSACLTTLRTADARNEIVKREDANLILDEILRLAVHWRSFSDLSRVEIIWLLEASSRMNPAIKFNIPAAPPSGLAPRYVLRRIDVPGHPEMIHLEAVPQGQVFYRDDVWLRPHAVTSARIQSGVYAEEAVRGAVKAYASKHGTDDNHVLETFNSQKIIIEARSDQSNPEIDYRLEHGVEIPVFIVPMDRIPKRGEADEKRAMRVRRLMADIISEWGHHVSPRGQKSDPIVEPKALPIVIIAMGIHAAIDIHVPYFKSSEFARRVVSTLQRMINDNPKILHMNGQDQARVLETGTVKASGWRRIVAWIGWSNVEPQKYLDLIFGNNLWTHVHNEISTHEIMRPDGILGAENLQSHDERPACRS